MSHTRVRRREFARQALFQLFSDYSKNKGLPNRISLLPPEARIVEGPPERVTNGNHMSRVADFNDSFERNIGRKYEQFFSLFYERFINASAEISALFERTDPERRREMLQDSMLLLLDFSICHQVTDDLLALARYHQTVGVSIHMFDAWLECLVATLREMDPAFSDADERAWRETLGPGVEFMKLYAN